MEGKRIGRKGRSCRSGPAAQMDGSKDREESKRASGGREGRRQAGKIRRGGGEARKQQNRTVKEGHETVARTAVIGVSFIDCTW